MTLAQGGTLPSVLQSTVEALTWPPSSPLNKREKRKRRRRTRSEGREDGDKERPRGETQLFGREETERGQRRPRKRRAEGRRGPSLVNNRYAITKGRGEKKCHPLPLPDTHQSIAASLWDAGIVI